MKLHSDRAWAMLGMREGDAGLRFTTAGYSAVNARLKPAVAMMRTLTAARGPSPDGPDGLTLLQFDDFAHQRVRSVAFGRLVGEAPAVELVMDPYFHAGGGYPQLRAAAEAGALPPWEAREDLLFWRGRGTHRHERLDGGPVAALSDAPRIATALRLRDHPWADVKILGAWIQPETEAEVLAWLRAERIYGAGRPMTEHARYKFQLDIDGVANAWALFERLLGGSCVLKVGSPFEMWFYDRLRPWEHFVPVAHDGSDLEARLDWCLSHPAEARAVAEAGQRFALAHTYDVALEETLGALRRCRLPL